jgi:hypothetical protein
MMQQMLHLEAASCNDPCCCRCSKNERSARVFSPIFWSSRSLLAHGRRSRTISLSPANSMAADCELIIHADRQKVNLLPSRGGVQSVGYRTCDTSSRKSCKCVFALSCCRVRGFSDAPLFRMHRIIGLLPIFQEMVLWHS